MRLAEVKSSLWRIGLVFLMFFSCFLSATILKAATLTDNAEPITVPSTSSSDVKTPILDKKPRSVTLARVPYVFKVIVSTPGFYVGKRDYGYHVAICPKGSTQISGPHEHAMVLLPKCSCGDKTYCDPPYTGHIENTKYGYSEATCLIKLFSYVLTDRIPNGKFSEIEPIKGHPDESSPFVYYFEDNLSNPILKSGGNPIHTLDLKEMNFNSGYRVYPEFGDKTSDLHFPCPKGD